jgi:hypothetical protein
MSSLPISNNCSQAHFKYLRKIESTLMDLCRENLTALYDLWIKCSQRDQPCNSREVLRAWELIDSNDQVRKNVRTVVLRCITVNYPFIWFRPIAFEPEK